MCDDLFKKEILECKAQIICFLLLDTLCGVNIAVGIEQGRWLATLSSVLCVIVSITCVMQNVDIVAKYKVLEGKKSGMDKCKR